MGKGKTTIPPPPPPSQEELDLLKKQTQSLDFYLKDMEEQKTANKEQGLLQQVSSGLYDPVIQDGRLIDATLNPDKLAKLQAQYAQSTELQGIAMDRYQRALEGKLPVSEGTLQSKEHDFQLLKEQAGRKGIQIEGNSLEEAATLPQNSTAGNELVSRLHKTYALQEDTERRGELNSAIPGNPGAVPLSLTANATSAFGPGAGAAGYIPAIGAAGAIAQPYQQQRALTYQGELNQASLNAASRAGTYQLIGTALGAGATAYAGKGG